MSLAVHRIVGEGLQVTKLGQDLEWLTTIRDDQDSITLVLYTYRFGEIILEPDPLLPNPLFFLGKGSGHEMR